MSYRNLRNPANENPREGSRLFQAACAYANYLWLHDLPARAILALCRAIYADPSVVPAGCRQPYRALVWFLRNDSGRGFLGNPRVSFARQATRVAEQKALQRHRAWALWHLTVRTRPDLSSDPSFRENPPALDPIAAYLRHNGLKDEDRHFHGALSMAIPPEGLQDCGSDSVEGDSGPGPSSGCAE